MVKIVDNYVLERVIGKGQFGEVFKGYNKNTGEDIAVKTVNRKNLKGKFYELLENEIKVLRTCNNANIIKLYDIKKTANNIYLILEFCNEGDLMKYLKQKSKLTEEEAIEILVQIFNAFKTLSKQSNHHFQTQIKTFQNMDTARLPTHCTPGFYISSGLPRN